MASDGEFAPGEESAAAEYIKGLPAEVRRIYVEEWDGNGWRFVYGDDRAHTPRGLTRLTPGRRFRIRPA
jgi:hypothetical protein